MNGPIRRVSLVVMLMFLALVVNLSYAYAFRTDSLNSDPNNRRVRDAQFGVDRGDILVGNTPVVTSVPVETRFSFQRTYASGALYAPVTGFFSFLFGGTGLEQYYSARLAGTDDAQFLQNLVNTATGKRPQGDSLQTTLDARAQRAAAQGLGNRPGAVVALDYTTGEVKALVSTPSFDPNELSSHDLNATQAAWQRLNSDPNRPMANRAVREIFPPGSTFKLVVAAAALESGMTPETMVDSPSTLRLPGSTFEMTGSCGGEQITLKQALRVSCNTAFANVGSQLGADALRRQAQRFGFGSTQLPELSGVASRFPANPDAAQTMLSSIGGFDVAASPLQMAMVAAAIANDGVLMEPHLVSQMRGPDLNVTSTRGAHQLALTMAPANARALQEMMVDVVENGTGRRAQISGVRVGGKTGTALTSSGNESSGRAPYAWFVAFADDPQVAVAVFVQDAGVDGTEISGGRFAAPIAQAVIESMR